MRSGTRRLPLWSLVVTALFGLHLAGGCGTEDFCLNLLAETIELGEQVIDLEENPEDIDIDIACQYLANVIRLVDEGCVDDANFEDSALPSGTSRETLLDLREAFGCPPS